MMDLLIFVPTDRYEAALDIFQKLNINIERCYEATKVMIVGAQEEDCSTPTIIFEATTKDTNFRPKLKVAFDKAGIRGPYWGYLCDIQEIYKEEEKKNGEYQEVADRERYGG